jgi:hypothetical protein
MMAEELATTRTAKLEMVAQLQDSWSVRAAECTTKSARPGPAGSEGSPLHRMTQKLGQVCIDLSSSLVE